MNEELKKIVVALSEQAKSAGTPLMAMQLAQAALNVAQAAAVIQNGEKK